MSQAKDIQGFFAKALIAVLLALTALPAAGRCDVGAVEVSPREVTVGDPVEVTVEVIPPEGATVIWPTAEQLQPAELLKLDTASSGASSRTARLTLALFEPGRVKLPMLPIVFTAGEGSDTVWVEAGSVTVKSVLAGQDSLQDIRDVKPPTGLPFQWRDALPYLLGALAAALLAFAARLLWKRFRKSPATPEIQAPPSVPPHIAALEKLEQLRLKRLWQSGYVKEFHSELTDIVKEYIGACHGINAPEMTTEELLAVRRAWKVDDDGFVLVRRILTVGDLVKFARFSSDPSTNEASLTAAFRYVELTKPVVSSAGTENGRGVKQ